MVTKEEWMVSFEQEHGRKPVPKEFVDARQNGAFEVADTESVLVSNVDSVVDAIDLTTEKEATIESNLANDDKASEPKLEEYVIGSKVFCFNCGKANQTSAETCIQCGTKLSKGRETRSFFSDFTSKLTEVSAIASKKTKELTHNAQANAQIFSERKKRETLIQALGNAYYERNKEKSGGEFQELFDEIKGIDKLIQDLNESIKQNH